MPDDPHQIKVVRLIARMNVGGPALQVTAMARYLDRARFDQHLLVGHVDNGEADYLDLRAPDVDVIRVPGLGRSVRMLGDVQALWFVYRYLRKTRPDIVHTHTAKAGVIGRVAAVAARVPKRVHTFHGHVLHGYFSPRVTKAVIIVERALARTTHRLVAVGGQVRDDLIAAKIGQADQYTTIAPGVKEPDAPDRATARAALGLPAAGHVVVFVGRLTQIKRAERFVDAAAFAKRLGIGATFVIIGDGPLRADLEAHSTSVDAGVRFLGWRSDVEVAYAAADLVVLTSDNEGMPVALIEAAMQGVPAVSTEVGAVRQVVEDGVSGQVVPCGDQAALNQAITDLLRDEPLRQRYSAAARAKARAEFSEMRLVGDIAALYESLMGP